MLQDLEQEQLNNQFLDPQPEPEDTVLCFRDAQVLIARDAGDRLTLPTWGQLGQQSRDWPAWPGQTPRYAFALGQTRFFLWMGQAGDGPEGFAYEAVRTLRQQISKDICFGVMTGWHLHCWYRDNRFCGRCGGATVHDQQERMLRCPQCGNTVYPRINPAVIIAVTHGDRLLLSKYAHRSYTRYALLAGFTEIGETLEQTVHREVMEEVGLKVKNLRYYKSQPWGVDGNVLMGFYCDLDGSDAIRLDTSELALAQWHPRDALPAKDDGISLTREMIRVFEEGKEPRQKGNLP